MMKKFVLLLCVAALGVASAKSFVVKLMTPSTINGTELMPGNYRINVDESKIVVSDGKQAVTALVKVESANETFQKTSIRYEKVGDRLTIKEIRLGGTQTKLLLY